MLLIVNFLILFNRIFLTLLLSLSVCHYVCLSVCMLQSQSIIKVNEFIDFPIASILVINALRCDLMFF